LSKGCLDTYKTFKVVVFGRVMTRAQQFLVTIGYLLALFNVIGAKDAKLFDSFRHKK